MASPPQPLPSPPVGGSWTASNQDESWDHPNYGGAAAVAAVLKITACVVLIGGVISAVGVAVQLHHSEASGNAVLGSVVGVVAGTIISAAAIAFFAYVLDLLIGIEWNTFVAMQMELAVGDEDEDEVD